MAFHCTHKNGPCRLPYGPASCLCLHPQLIPPALHSTTVAFSQSPEEAMLSGGLKAFALLYYPEVSREIEPTGCVCMYI